MNVLIIGAKGQLGYDFQRLLRKEKIEFLAVDYDELDVTNSEKIELFFSENNNFDVIINCAAYNNVDRAEIERNQCVELNEKAPVRLAEFAQKIDAVFVTYSTDFVFDGKKKSPYTEDDTPNPLSLYGMSKYMGEAGVINEYEKTFVIRTSWVFGVANNNFNKQVLEWSKSKKELSIVDDQISAPTYSADLAEYSWLLIKSGKFGLYHLTNEGECSKYHQALYILEKIGWHGKITGVKTETFNLPAKRANYSKLSSEKAEKIIGKRMPDWKNAIDRYMIELKESGELL